MRDIDKLRGVLGLERLIIWFCFANDGDYEVQFLVGSNMNKTL